MEQEWGRNRVAKFARRTWKNFEHIESALKNQADVHVITQLANSMLGLVIFPWEKRIQAELANQTLAELTARGWPALKMEGAKCRTLGELVRRLRNGFAHREIWFTSDSRHIEDVSIHIENHWKNERTWSMDITAKDLRVFCANFVQLLEEVDD
jgi:hypothetical protein